MTQSIDQRTGQRTALQTPHFQQLLDQCIHCGLCLPACPTYNVLHTEMDSPRGRIQLMRAAAEERIDTNGAFAQHIDLCLGCRACETACPSGVHYGQLLEVTRAVMVAEHPPSQLAQSIRRFALHKLLPRPDRLRWLARLLWLYQRTGLSTLVQKLPGLPVTLRTMEAILPPITLRFPDYSQSAPALGKKRGTVAFLRGCVQEAFLSGANAATIHVLQRNGYEVHFPQGQTCCGAAPLHIGEGEYARTLARQNIDAFSQQPYDAILNNAGGCGATLKEYAHLLADDPAYAEKARHFVARLQDINEFLADYLCVQPTGRIAARVTYIDSCHLRHGQKVARQPRQLLKLIPGLTLVEVQQTDMCCGSAGVYNLMQPVMATQVLDAKLQDVAATQPEIIATANPGCHMQMVYGVKRAGLKAEVVHVVELLERSYQRGERSV
jgi:glycolate oxidase iron-sulfur subunit